MGRVNELVAGRGNLGAGKPSTAIEAMPAVVQTETELPQGVPEGVVD